MVGRIPVMDVMPLVDLGRLPAKATAGEPLPVSATVFREGHDQLGAEVVLVAPDGTRRPPVRMVARRRRRPTATSPGSPPTPRAPGPSRCTPGPTRSRPGSTTAGLKIPAGVDVELMFTEGGLLLDEVAADPGARRAREARCVAGAASAARDTSRPVEARLAALQSPELVARPRRAPAARAGHRRGPLPAVRRPAARAVRQLVRVLPAVGGRDVRREDRARWPAARSGPPPSGSTPWPRWAST